jgi:hypothetical protein
MKSTEQNAERATPRESAEQSSGSAKDAQPRSLVNKLVEILADLGPVEKRGRNEHFKYNYVSEGQMMAELRDRLSSRGIFLFTSVEEITPHYGANGEAKGGVFVCVKTKHTFRDVETGEEEVVFSGGVGWDSGDKGAYKAITGATKYALMKNFLVTDEINDPESSGRGPAGRTAPGAVGHRRTRAYDEEGSEGNKQATKDLDELKSFLSENKIPDGFLLALLREKQLIDGRVKEVGAINPGILRRVLAKSSLANLIKAWAAQQAGSSSSTEPPKGKAAPPAKTERGPFDNGEPVRTSEGDQSRSRQPVLDDMHPRARLEKAGYRDWREVEIHFGDKKDTPLGKLTTRSLAWWIENYKPKQFKNRWQPKDMIFDAALCLADAEMKGGE